ncbi:hypothetical protein AVEN_214634-1 [Araneus ventricosus]|uniref:Uncharacterized protein n=1 Tax=Araneus ventricosus TaxID=182803 RepID=A0A4Y2LCU4_ARAVE|nr:hypothetical protein AVEN_214634-1 [Araneus ventricosus]
MDDRNFNDSEENSDQWPVVGISSDIFGNFPNISSPLECSMSFGSFLRYSVLLTALYGIAYGLKILVGMIGNMCDIHLITREKSSLGEYIKFLSNLLVADFLRAIFCISSTNLGHLFGREYCSI